MTNLELSTSSRALATTYAAAQELVATLEGGIPTSDALMHALQRIPLRHWEVRCRQQSDEALREVTARIASHGAPLLTVTLQRIEQFAGDGTSVIRWGGEVTYLAPQSTRAVHHDAADAQLVALSLNNRPMLIDQLSSSLLPLLGEVPVFDAHLERIRTQAATFAANEAWAKQLVEDLLRSPNCETVTSMDVAEAVLLAECELRGDAAQSEHFTLENVTLARKFERGSETVEIYAGRLVQYDEDDNPYPFTTLMVVCADSTHDRRHQLSLDLDFHGNGPLAQLLWRLGVRCTAED